MDKKNEVKKFDYPLLAIDIPKMAAQMQGKSHQYYPRASNTGTERCARADVYHGLNIPREPFPGRAMLIFSDSSFHEDLTNDWIRKLQYKLHSEQMGLDCLTLPFGKDIRRYCSICKKEYPGNIVHGHPDGILTNIITLEDFLYEHKAVSHFQFERYEGGEVPLDYVSQCCSYLCGSKKLLPNIDKAVLLIKNKNSARYMQFVIHYDFDNDVATVILAISDGKVKNEKVGMVKDTVKRIIDRYVFVNEYIQKKTLPLRQYEIDHFRCEYCGWGKVCYEKYQEEFDKLVVTEEAEKDVQDEVGYYLEANMHRMEIEKEAKEMKKEEDKVKDRILTLMKEKDLRKARVGDYILERMLKESKSLNKKILPIDMIQKATEIKRTEKFQIRKVTQKQLKEEALKLQKGMEEAEDKNYTPPKEERGTGKPPEFSKKTKIETD